MDELKVMTLNLGFNVMGDIIAGSEGGQTAICHDRYGLTSPKLKDVPRCTMNSTSLITECDLVGLQEMNLTDPDRQISYLRAIVDQGKAKGRNYQCFTSSYFGGNWGVTIIADQNTLGEGIPVTPKGLGILDPADPLSRRGFQLVYFPKVKLLVANTHAPHHIPLARALWYAFYRATPYLTRLGISDDDIDELIMTGDFNDHNGEVLDPQFKLELYGVKLQIPYHLSAWLSPNIDWVSPDRRRLSPDLIPKTCCQDSNYQAKGDYILYGGKKERVLMSYGVPPGYDRGLTPISDHDPLMMVIVLGQIIDYGMP